MSQAKRRYPIGAELIGENQTHFRVWAPKARDVDVVLEEAKEAKPKFFRLTAESDGYFSGTADVGAGMPQGLVGRAGDVERNEGLLGSVDSGGAVLAGGAAVSGAGGRSGSTLPSSVKP